MEDARIARFTSSGRTEETCVHSVIATQIQTLIYRSSLLGMISSVWQIGSKISHVSAWIRRLTESLDSHYGVEFYY